MKKLKYFLFSLLLFLFFSPKVFAGVNMSTSYNVDMFDYKTYLEDSNCGGSNLYDFLNDYISSIDWSSAQNQLFVGINLSPSHNPEDIRLYFVPTSYVNQTDGNKIWTFGLYQTSGWNNQFKVESSKNTSGAGYMVINKNNCSSTTDLVSAMNFLTTTAYSSPPANSISNPGFSWSSTSVYYNVAYYLSSRLADNTSYNVGGWWYYSSYDLYFASQSQASGTNKYWKTIHINDNNTDYSYNDKLPSYYDLYPPQEQPTYIGYKTQLDTFYTNLNPNSLNNYNLKIKFKVPQSNLLGYYITPQEYIDNTTFNYVCSGRIDNNGYYNYESFPCSLLESHVLTNNSIEYTFNNVSTSQTLTNYDKIYITINPSYLDPNVLTIAFDFTYVYNLGSFYNTSYKGIIYENFNNLDLNFKYYLSSNNPSPLSKVYIDKTYLTNDIKFSTFFNSSQRQFDSIFANTYEEDSNFSSYFITNDSDTGLLIYQENGSTNLSRLNLFFNDDIYISSDSLGNSEFYYIDSSGNVLIGIYSTPISIGESDNYDISSYSNIVVSFINDFTSDIVELQVLTQTFYNGLPTIFQTFLFVLFILSCIYFTYLLIKK